MPDTGYIENQLDYVADDYIGVPGSPVAFLLGSTDALYFSRSPGRPGKSLGLIQPRTESAAAEAVVHDYLAKDSIVELSWERMCRIDRDRLISWWRDTARGMAVAFTYVDINGVQATVRFASPRLPEIRERAHDSYEVHVSLRVI